MSVPDLTFLGNMTETLHSEREFFIDNLLVRIHSIIDMFQ